MILLPDMVFDIDGVECKLSLQDPYTLNGKLITDVDAFREPQYTSAYNALGQELVRYASGQHYEIKMMNENNFAIRIDLATLKFGLNRTLEGFFAEHGNSVTVGENPRYEWTIGSRYGVPEYLRDLSDQYSRLRASNGLDYLNKCRTRLSNQGRRNTINCDDLWTLDRERMYIRPSEIDTLREISEYVGSIHDESISIQPVATSTTNRNLRNYSTTSSISGRDVSTSETLLDETIGSLERNIQQLETAIDRINRISIDLNNSENNSENNPVKKYIHPYNYKPEYIKHQLPDEHSPLLLGCEIEIDCGGESEKHAKKVLEIMCGIDPENPGEVLEDKIYCMHDGSLTNGMEFASMPCSLEYHKKEMKYKEMFEYLDKHGYKAHDTSTCGLHIHADRSYLGKSELVQQLTISKILYILEKFNDEICVIARRDNRYCRFVGKNEVNKSLDKLYDKYKKDKYVALNLAHDASIEFRCFKGTLKYETFILTLEFVKDIIDYAKTINIEEIELIQWNDLMDTFSDELKAYYNNRFEKEKKKKKNYFDIKCNIASSENVNANMSTISNDILGNGTIFMNGTAIGNVSRGIIINEIPRGNVIFTAEDTRNLILENNTVHDDSIDTLKKEIKQLKKQIKNSRNYMEQKRLKEELNEKQKELKNLKKRNRNAELN